MLLVVDVGNTNIVLGVYEGANLARDWRIETRKHRTGDEYGALLHQLFLSAGLEPTAIHSMIVSSVVPPLTHSIVKVGRDYLGVDDVLVVGQGIKTGMPIRYENPREVGADRIVNSVAARAHVGGKLGLIVCDFGTATTFDVVSPRGDYLGGAIAPGIRTSLEALFHAASKLPRIDLDAAPPVVGRTTVASMQSGTLYGYVGLVEGMVRRMTAELDFEPWVVATGGLAPLIARHTDVIRDVLPMLTLEGLRLLWNLNRPEASYT